MKTIFTFFLLFINFYAISQKIDRDKETLETIEWINSKVTEYRYEEPDLKQIFLIKNILKEDNEYFIIGVREQVTSKPWAAKYYFKIPISKINSISFSEKKSNYWIEIKMKNNEEAISLYNDSESRKIYQLELMLNKDIDNENLKPRFIKAFYYLLELYGNKKSEKF